MNKIELTIYNIVRHNPGLKRKLRDLYQCIFDILPREKNFFINEPIVKEGFFWGFHDQTPFSKDNEILLANKLLIPLRMPNKQDCLEIGFFSGKDYSIWNKIATTRAWNYHKGCRLQWAGENKVIFNSYDQDERLGSTIYILENKSPKFYKGLPFPIDSVAYQGLLATSFSYYRLEKMMPGYGYSNLGYDETEIDTSKTGLFLNDLSTGYSQLMFSIEELKAFEHSDDMDDAYHFVTHSLFSKDDKYIAFLHRWYTSHFQKTRLLVANIETRELYSSPTSGMVSHYIWTDNNDIIAFCSIDSIFSHVLFHSPLMKNPTRVGYPAINSDGHQTPINKNLFITDTYPDKMRMANMYLVDSTKENSTKLIARVNSPKRFQSPDNFHHWACDLHPRASNDGKLISFDSVHTGERSLCVMKLNYPISF